MVRLNIRLIYLLVDLSIDIAILCIFLELKVPYVLILIFDCAFLVFFIVLFRILAEAMFSVSDVQVLKKFAPIITLSFEPE